MSPRLLLSLRRKEPADPVRIYSDAVGTGEVAGISFFARDEAHLPTLVVAQADQKLQALAATSNEIYIFELFASAASVLQLRGRS